MPPLMYDEPKEDVSLRRQRLLREAQERYKERHPGRTSETRRRCEAKETSKDKRRLRQKRHHLQNRLRAIAELGGKCYSCGQSFHHAAMDFHHLDPTTKETKGKGLPCNGSWKSVQKELVKTILLCANCHRIHHYEERNTDV